MSSAYIGLSIEEFRERFNGNYRIVREDDQVYMVTMDHNPGRLNLELDNGYITAVRYG